MMDNNVEYEIDNDWENEVLTSDDCYVEEVDNTTWITELIRRDVFEEKHRVDLD